MFVFNNPLFDIDKNVKCHDIAFAIYRREKRKVYDELNQTFLSHLKFSWTSIKTVKTRIIVCWKTFLKKKMVIIENTNEKYYCVRVEITDELSYELLLMKLEKFSMSRTWFLINHTKTRREVIKWKFKKTKTKSKPISNKKV